METCLAEIWQDKGHTSMYVERRLRMLKTKISAVRIKANCMEDRLRVYRGAIEELGFKRVK